MPTLIPTSLKQFYRNSGGSTSFPNFYSIHCTPHLFNLSSPHCTLYLTSISAIILFFFNIYQLFHMLLLDFLLIIYTYFHRPTFIFKTTNPNNAPLLPSPLLGNSKQLTTITTQINFLHRLPSFLIHSHIYYSLSIFFASQYFFLSSSLQLCFQILNNSLIQHTATSTSLRHPHV